MSSRALPLLLLLGAPALADGTPPPHPPKAPMSDEIPFKTKPRKPETPPPRSTVTLPDHHDDAARLPVVRSAADLAAHDGQLARIVGTYEEVDVRMHQAPPPRHVGHVALRLADDTTVALWPVWDARALRPVAEVERFAGHAVEVVGVVHEHAPAEPHGGASPTGPCVSDPKALYPAK